MNNKLDKMNEKIDYLTDRVNQIFNILSGMNRGSDTEKILPEVKSQKFDIDNAIVKECLEMNNTKGDMMLIEHMYFTEDDVPIRTNNLKDIEYFSNKKWNLGDKELIGILVQNIKSCYLLANSFNNYIDNPDKFMKNQKYITELSGDKYKERLTKSLKTFLDKT